MALISSGITVVAAEGGPSEPVMVFRISGVNTGDTVDLKGYFASVKNATFIPSGLDFSTVGTASISGTIVTMTLTGLTNDHVYLMAVGESLI